MTKKTKENLQIGFSSIISNDACIRGGRELPWYVAILLAVFALLISVIPMTASSFSYSAASFLDSASATYGYETGLVQFIDDLSQKGVTIGVNGETSTLTGIDSFQSAYGVNSWYSHVDAEGNTTFEVFAFGESEDYNERVLRIIGNFNPYTGDARFGSDTANKTYHTNALVLGHNYWSVYKFSSDYDGSNGRYGAITGKYDIGRSFTFASLSTKDTHGKNYDLPAGDVDAHLEAVRSSFKQFLNDGFNSTKIVNAWISVGEMALINAVTMFLMGLMIFLMTRGKRNPFRIYTFWDSQKIAYWCAPTPAVLAMILGFMFSTSSYSLFFFLLMFGLRVMWLSMRSLRPAQ